MKEIVFFSNNKNKIYEVSNMFLNISLKLLTLNDFKKISSPLEIGKTFEENAKIKSTYGLKKIKKICFADDSGISIEAMDGLPGILSKDFFKKKNKMMLLNEIISITKKKNNFNAFFQTSICLSLSTSKHIFFKGKIKGIIAKNIRGENGFGYDPIFIPLTHKKTFSEMSQNEKNSMSHRAIAIQKLKKYLLKLF